MAVKATFYKYTPRKKQHKGTISKSKISRFKADYFQPPEEIKKAELKRLKEQYSRYLTDMFSPVLKDEYVILDTETTGVDPKESRIIDLSIIDMDGRVLFSSLLNPGVLLPEKITAITGLTDDDLVGHYTFHFIAPGIMSLLEHKKVICWNASFDKSMIFSEFSRTAYKVDCDWICAMHLYHILKMDRKGKWPKLQAAMEAEGISKSQEHRALADCKDTLAVLKRISEYIPLQLSLFDEATDLEGGAL